MLYLAMFPVKDGVYTFILDQTCPKGDQRSPTHEQTIQPQIETVLVTRENQCFLSTTGTYIL